MEAVLYFYLMVGAYLLGMYDMLDQGDAPDWKKHAWRLALLSLWPLFMVAAQILLNKARREGKLPK